MRTRTVWTLALACSVTAQVTTPASPAAGVDGDRLASILAGDEPKNPAELLAMQQHVQQLVARVDAATVSLGGASGVLVRRDGVTYVLSAAHVTRSKGRPMQITLADGKRLDGETLGCNARTDVGLIRVTSEGEFPCCEFGESGKLAKGQWVLMLGHPSGRKEGRQAPARLGRVLRVPQRGYLVTDCTMQGGDSGGPLVDMDGRVVGINSRISANLAENMHAPIDAFTVAWQDLVNGVVVEQPSGPGARGGRGGRGRPRATIGAPVEWEDGHAVVGAVPPDSAAAAAGLLPGDVVVSIGEQKITERADLFRALRGAEPGTKVAVAVRRGEETVVLELTIERNAQ